MPFSSGTEVLVADDFAFADQRLQQWSATVGRVRLLGD